MTIARQARSQGVRWVRTQPPPRAKMVRVVEYLIITVSPQEWLSPPTVEHSLKHALISNGSSLWCVLMYEVFFKFYSCNGDIKPSAAFSCTCRHIKYKIHAPECIKARHFYFKIQKFSGEGALPHSYTHPLDLYAFSAHSRTPHSEVWLRACKIKALSSQPTCKNCLYHCEFP